MANCVWFPLILLGLLFNVPAVAAAAAPGAPSCAENPAARQLDFWLGDWSVDSGRGRSKVHLALDKCELLESWASTTSDHSGENTLAFDPDNNAWYGLFVDNRGRVHSFRGSVSSGAAELQGPGRDENGALVLKRVRVVRINDATVDQIWEKSTDQGESWTLEFKMEYIRKNP
jgi:hypothetical protein